MKASQHPEAAFLAAMTASATHEVRNVLAIIKESAGLVEDMVHVFSKKGVLDQEKVYRTVDRIDAQVRRGAELLTHLNRLAHTLDQDFTEVELHQEVEQAVFLSQRFARKKGHRVVAGEPAPQVFVSVSALRLHMTLFAAMELCLEELPEGAAVTVEVLEDTDREARVEFRGEPGGGADGGGPSDAEVWAHLEKRAASIGARVERREEGFGIRILFPREAGS